MTYPTPTLDSSAALLTRATELIAEYFTTLNAGDFAATAHRFAADGVLHPPFDRAVQGQSAIAAYLAAEAEGIELIPLHETIEPVEDGTLYSVVTGKVQTSLFSVNVEWSFRLDTAPSILSVKIKLLAALPELLSLKQMKDE